MWNTVYTRFWRENEQVLRHNLIFICYLGHEIGRNNFWISFSLTILSSHLLESQSSNVSHRHASSIKPYLLIFDFILSAKIRLYDLYAFKVPSFHLTMRYVWPWAVGTRPDRPRYVTTPPAAYLRCVKLVWDCFKHRNIVKVASELMLQGI